MNLALIDSQTIFDTVILCHVTGLLQVPQGPLAGENKSTQILLLLNIDGAWKIRAFHNTFIKDLPEAPTIE